MPTKADLDALSRVYNEASDGESFAVRDGTGTVIGHIRIEKGRSKTGGIYDRFDRNDNAISRLGEGNRCPTCGR